MEEPKNTNDIHEDFEMAETKPEVKHYKEMDKTGEKSAEPQVNPSSEGPEKKTIGQAKHGLEVKPVNVEARRKALLGCMGAVGVVLIIFLVVSFVFISQTTQDTINPIAQLLGVNQGSFINGLITLVHVIFVLISLLTFVFAMIGLFRAGMAKKDDKIAKRKGIKMSLFSSILLFIILMFWVFAYAYLDGKRVNFQPQFKDQITTIPEETLNLTAPIEVIFKAENLLVDKRKYRVISHDWDFGDGEKNTGQIVAHTFEGKGRFDVVLSVTKQDKVTGEEAIDQYSVIVSVENEALRAVIEADPQSGGAPLEVKLSGEKSSDPDGKISRYEWDLDDDGEFDDGKGAKITHTFEKIGKYTVSLRVVSTTDEFSVVEKEIVVEKLEEPKAEINIKDNPERFELGVKYVFKAENASSPNGDIKGFSWDFGDGSKPESTKTVSHSFEKAGTYDIELTVIDEEKNEGKILKTITVGGKKGAPMAKISTNPAISDGELVLEGQIPFTVVFDAGESTDIDNNIVDYKWDFDGDGEADKFGKGTSYTFKDEGTFTVNLTVVDADDNESKATVAVKAKSKGITAAVNADFVEGSVPLVVKFDASGSIYSKGKITSYKWDFGDGSAPKLGSAEISHKYTQIGTFTASVTVIGADNSQDTKEILITVREIPLKACFVSVFEEGNAPLTTSFDPGCSTGSAVKYFWDFADGGTSTKINPSHTFETAGTYNVVLELTDSENTVSKAEVTINVK